jgi:hypothetical protein
MSFLSAVASLFRSRSGKPAFRRTSRLSGLIRPGLESLEDRSVPSAGPGLFGLTALGSAPTGGPTAIVAPDSHTGRELDWQVKEAGSITGSELTPQGLRMTFQSEGEARHAGRITETGVLLRNGNDITGTATVTTANGDQIFGVITAQVQSDGTITGHYYFIGGTGHFAGASGFTTWTATVAPDQVNFTVSCSGTFVLP